MKTKRWAPLYKLTNAGKIQEWEISAKLVENGNNSYGIYSILHGQKDGKKQYTETEIFSGKNLGKKNETSIWEQTCLEAEAIWTKKQERSGYTLYIPESKPFRPMLAKNFAEQTHNIIYPGYVQPKLNGCVTGDTFIKTKEYGYKPISWIVNNQVKCKVSSYNALSKKIEYKEIEGFWKNKESSSEEWIEIETEEGEKLVLTADHPVFLPDLDCFREAGLLKEGQSLTVI